MTRECVLFRRFASFLLTGARCLGGDLLRLPRRIWHPRLFSADFPQGYAQYFGGDLEGLHAQAFSVSGYLMGASTAVDRQILH